jgi:acetyl esterase/lipase
MILIAIVASLVMGAGLFVWLDRDANESASAAASAGGITGKGDKLATTTKAPPTPDVLPDPGVPLGACKELTYTPPTSAESQIGRLCRPANQRDVAVILVHGGSGIGGSYAGMQRWADRLGAEGYVTLQAEYHLFTPGSSESPVFPRPEQDIKAAVQFLRGTGNALGIAKDRIVVQGMSAGARVGSVAFTTPNDPWFAGPNTYADISDEVNGFIGFYHPYDGTMQYASQYFGGSDSSTSAKVIERYDKADALANATNATGPAIFLVGERDWNIIVEQQNEFADAIKAKGLDASTFVYPRGGHGFDEGGSRLTRLGEQAATDALVWLNEQFPQTPERPAQLVTPDLSKSSSGTGQSGTTVPRRTRRPGTSPTTVWRSTTSKAGSGATTTIAGGAGGGDDSTPATSLTPTTPTPTTAPQPSTTGSPPTSTP